MAKFVDNIHLLNQQNFLNKIVNEVKRDHYINAFLLLHGYIESFLLEIIFYTTKNKKLKLNKKIIERLEKINLNSLLHINLILNNISFDLYKRIYHFNSQRNKIVHELITIDLNDKAFKKKIKKQIDNGIEICKKLSEIYSKMIKDYYMDMISGS